MKDRPNFCTSLQKDFLWHANVGDYQVIGKIMLRNVKILCINHVKVVYDTLLGVHTPLSIFALLYHRRRAPQVTSTTFISEIDRQYINHNQQQEI